GDSWLLNSPYHGGTHLPDMTVVTPVFMGARARPRFFVASRAHHADIGGMTPGSMPPFSRTIEEEGALFECFALVSGGKLRERGPRAAPRARRLHRHLARGRTQLQRAARGVHGGGAVCVPHAHRAADSAERGLPRAPRARDSSGVTPRPPAAGRGGCRQRRDLAVH